MYKDKRHLLRGAIWLHEQYLLQRRTQRARNATYLAEALAPCVGQLCRQQRLLCLAIARHFDGAASRIQDRCDRGLQELERILEMPTRRFRDRILPPPTLTELYQEFVSTGQEFGNLEISRSERRISATTEPIHLDHIYLGPFRIDLLIDELERGDPTDWLRIEALDPHPSDLNVDVTHPHVEAGHLCVGAARAALQSAMLQGRISECFLIVRAVLLTYNHDSPYVRLDEWHGQECRDCGLTMSPDDALLCSSCEESYCNECTASCDVCDLVACRGCLQQSELSDRRACERCIEHCEGCEARCTSDELTDVYCDDCREETLANRETSNEDAIDRQESERSEDDAARVSSAPQTRPGPCPKATDTAEPDLLGPGVAEASIPLSQG